MQAEVDVYEDTEFNDALRARGIIPAKPPSRSPSPEAPEPSEVRNSQLKKATVSDLDAEIDALENVDDDEEERRLLALRRKRLQDLAREKSRGLFGRVYPITRPDYTREVTDASKAQQEEVEGEEARAKGTGVVCFLYKEGMDTCQLLAGYLDTLAAKYPSTKFVSIIGDKCIPNYPDRNLPTLIIYRDGELHRQIVGLRPEIGLDGLNTKCEDIELLLTAVGVLDKSQVPGSATFGNENGKSGKDSEDEDEGFGGNRRKTKQTIRSQEEDDADLDWDL
ncbi:hypothetical protein CBS101457_004051 [Exobasidium rhododendri]|nr:hypothetical protein CBS101457_004051 [Exobasidium rhododendri]